LRRGSGWGWRYGEEDEYGIGLARVGGLDRDGVGDRTGTVIRFRIVMMTGIAERDGKDEMTGLG
jgi:hypothetical protein